jgi:hypothetical protein
MGIEKTVGILKSIDSLESMFRRASNGVYGPNGRSWEEFVEIITKFTIKTDSGEKSFSYIGIILQDSIGNNVTVNSRKDIALKLYDHNLPRTYNTILEI